MLLKYSHTTQTEGNNIKHTVLLLKLCLQKYIKIPTPSIGIVIINEVKQRIKLDANIAVFSDIPVSPFILAFRNQTKTLE